MASTSIFIVTKKDVVVQVTGYIVRAKNAEHAARLVDDGIYIEETCTATVDHLESETASVEEISESGEGQETHEG